MPIQTAGFRGRPQTVGFAARSKSAASLSATDFVVRAYGDGAGTVTLDPLVGVGTLSNGNLTLTTTGGNIMGRPATLGRTDGIWAFEVATLSGGHMTLGIVSDGTYPVDFGAVGSLVSGSACSLYRSDVNGTYACLIDLVRREISVRGPAGSVVIDRVPILIPVGTVVRAALGCSDGGSATINFGVSIWK